MKMLFASALLISTVVANLVNAEQSRLSRLSESYLMSNVERDGEWEVQIAESSVLYSCLVCSGQTTASLELIEPYVAGNFGTLERRYIAERKQYCADLTMDGRGRCVDTQPTGLRAGALSGYVSESEVSGRQKFEIVFFYYERGFEPTLIRTRLTIEDGSFLPNDAIRMFHWHMAKTTHYW